MHGEGTKRVPAPRSMDSNFLSPHLTDDRSSVHKDVLDHTMSIIRRTGGEEVIESFTFGADFHGLDCGEKRFILQAKNQIFFINNFNKLIFENRAVHTFT